MLDSAEQVAHTGPETLRRDKGNQKQGAVEPGIRDRLLRSWLMVPLYLTGPESCRNKTRP
jgi:hypothetical protein